MNVLWGYFIGTFIGSFLGVLLATAWQDVIDDINQRNRRR